MNHSMRPLDACSAWNPGVENTIPPEFRSLETIFRSECASRTPQEVDEFASLTGLSREELAVFRPSRLALHEIIVRVTADIAVAEGETEEVFGLNFRRIARRIRDDYVAPEMAAIEASYTVLRERTIALVREILADTLFAAPAPPAARRFPFSLLPASRRQEAAPEPALERAHRLIAAFRSAALSEQDPLKRAVLKSLYRVLGAIASRIGGVGADPELLANLVTLHVCNRYGSREIGQQIAPLIEAAIDREGYTRVRNHEAPVLISLKGASAAGKSSLRPRLREVLREQGIAAHGYATISPDVWRRLLLDYEALGPAFKYAGHLTSREVMVIDGKLDRYMRDKARRSHSIPHLLVDRFRFDSFEAEQVARVLHDTYAKYVHTMYMYFVVTPPEETVERGWHRALEVGRYKSVEDFLGHSVEAYRGMPKILFKWLAYRRPEYRYFFLDNRVPKGTFPKTIAHGTQGEITIYDPVAFVDIERYQKIDIGARAPDEVYPAAQVMAVSANCGFLKECIRRIERVRLVDPATGTPYLQARNGIFEVLDPSTLGRLAGDPEISAVVAEIAPRLLERIG